MNKVNVILSDVNISVALEPKFYPYNRDFYLVSRELQDKLAALILTIG